MFAGSVFDGERTDQMDRGVIRFLRQHSIALLALFVALGGTSMAAVQLARNSVGTLQVRNGSLQTIDLSKKARKALKGNRGLRGAQGPVGGQGAKGPTGAKGATGAQGPGPSAGSVGSTLLKSTYSSVVGTPAPTAGVAVDAVAPCNPGDRVLGGGFAWNDMATTGSNMVYSTQDPLNNPTQWVVRGSSATAGNTLYAWALCLTG
jgi:hypothetical protein